MAWGESSFPGSPLELRAVVPDRHGAGTAEVLGQPPLLFLFGFCGKLFQHAM